MMSRFVVFFFTFLSLLIGSQIHAAPAREIIARQIGDLQCNIDRLSIVGELTGLQGTLKTLSGQVGSNATAAAGIQSATDSITGAQGAIGVIAKALFTGQTAPASAREQVQGNLTAAQATLASLSSSDATVSANLKKALTELGNSAAAGEGVVANCN